MIDTGSTTRFRVLHALAVKGVASDSTLVEVTGEDEGSVIAEIHSLLATELVRTRKGKLGGYALTQSGKEVHCDLLAAEFNSDAVAALDYVYTCFLPVNGRFKDLCTRWQLRGADLNDHSDARYDDAVIAELSEIDEEARSFLMRATEQLPRFGRYPVRLAAALGRVQEGDHAAFTKPLTDSYHDVWMELHEDLLRSLGRTRGTEDEG